MIHSTNTQGGTRTTVRNDTSSLLSDTTPPRGSGEGFRPHDLLEAALASCLAITLRLVAVERELPLIDVHVKVHLDRSSDEKTVFRVHIDLDGPLSYEQRQILLAAARRCPVRKTLSKSIAFDETAAPTE
jgi:putative redox protein